MHKPLRIIACVYSMLVLAGCVTYEPMPQALYGGQYQTLFMDIPDSLKSSKVDVLYATDRALDEERGILLYGSDRSFSLAFGVARVNLGKDLSWDDLVAWTMTQGVTGSDIEPEVESVTEITRLPSSPYRYVLDQNGQAVLDLAIASKRQAVHKQIQEIVSSRLGLSEHKQIHIHIHGVKDQFGETLIRLAVSHHLWGRQGVPILYSWPAGAPGLLRNYTRDRESGEFTIFHLKEFIRTIAAIDEIEQINISAHSRGTDVILTALRELVIEARASGIDPRRSLKISNLVLIAPDLDTEVSSQRITAETLAPALGRVTIYINNTDKAIRLSTMLFASDERVGSTDPSELADWQKQTLQATTNVDVIFYSGTQGGGLGHSYYRAPVILADIFLLYDGKLPGADNGRPLKKLGDSVWAIDDSYLE